MAAVAGSTVRAAVLYFRIVECSIGTSSPHGAIHGVHVIHSFSVAAGPGLKRQDLLLPLQPGVLPLPQTLGPCQMSSVDPVPPHMPERCKLCLCLPIGLLLCNPCHKQPLMNVPLAATETSQNQPSARPTTQKGNTSGFVPQPLPTTLCQQYGNWHNLIVTNDLHNCTGCCYSTSGDPAQSGSVHRRPERLQHCSQVERPRDMHPGSTLTQCTHKATWGQA